MIDKLSAATAKVIKRNAPDHPTSEKVLKYALEGVYNVFFVVSLSLIFSMFTGRTVEVALAMLPFAMLRQITGGIHLKSGVACVIVSTALFTALSFINLNKDFELIISVFSLILILAFAPARIENQSRIPRRFYRYLKAAGAVLVAVGFMIGNNKIILSLFVQSLTLVHLKGGEHHD